MGQPQQSADIVVEKGDTVLPEAESQVGVHNEVQDDALHGEKKNETDKEVIGGKISGGRNSNGMP